MLIPTLFIPINTKSNCVTTFKDTSMRLIILYLVGRMTVPHDKFTVLGR